MFRELCFTVALASLGLMPTELCAQPNASHPSSAASDALDELLDRVWDFELKADPLLATDVGDPRYQDRLPDVSLTTLAKRDAKRQAFLKELTAIDRETLSQTRKLDAELLRLRLQRDRDDYRLGLHMMPINNRGGFHVSFPELPKLMNPRTVKDFENYIARLKDFPRYAQQQTELLQAGIDAGFLQPRVIMRDSAKQAEAHVVQAPEQSLLLSEINDASIKRLPEGEWPGLRDQIVAAIGEHVVPAYRDFTEFLEQSYLPACRSTIAAESLPGGRELYRHQIQKFTTIEVTADQLHQTGLEENERIRREMEAVMRDVDFDGELAEFIEHLRTDPRFYAETAEQLMKEVAYVLKRADGRLPDLFGRLPRIPYGIREVPAFIAPQTTTAYYWPPATDGSRGGFYYVNTYNLKSRPLYQLQALSLHEAVPGHHLQLAIQAELEDVHPIRRQSRFTAFIEGWALYSERLGKELGFYQDPYQEFGRLSMEAWRASRLVVDTGIHAKGWSRSRAIEYMKNNTALSEHNVVAEVDRYIGWPGQALAYKVGEIFIRKLRARAESELGDGFDVRQFHDAVLRAGSIPLPVLEQRIEAFIAEASIGD